MPFTHTHTHFKFRNLEIQFEKKKKKMPKEDKEHKLFTLVFVFDRDENRLLLGLKKYGFGSNKYNGFGGKVEVNEEIESAAMRELEEECGLIGSKNDLIKVGIILFEFNQHQIVMEVHIFMIDLTNTSGSINESEEMKPQWFKLDEIPFHQMWTDDKFWFPFMFDRKLFQGHFLYEAIDSDIVLKHKLTEVSSLTNDSITIMI